MWNDKETDIDLLGHDKLAQTVIEIIQDYHLRPLTIGVYGDWGVGKSSIISILQKKIREIQQLKIARIHCIVFNGWLFQGYEDAKSALMATIVAELAALQPNNKKIQKLASSLIRRVNWLKVAKVGAGAAFTALTGIPDLGILSGIAGLAKKGKELFSDKSDSNTTNVTVSTEDESFLKEYEEETITGQISAFRKEFAELIKTSKVDHVVVLVDDLDRCLPKSVIETLEAIRLFLFVEGTTFVFSADERMIEYAVREHFPNLPASYSDYTKSYLEKLIQIPIRIPLLNQLQTGNYVKFLLLQEYLKHDYEKLIEVYEHFNRQKKKPYDPVELTNKTITEVLSTSGDDLNETILVGNHLTPTLSSGLKGNPRNIKRFLNTLFLRLRIARIYGLDGDIKLNVLAKLMLLERFQPVKFAIIVDEVSANKDGISEMIANAETESQSDDKNAEDAKTIVDEKEKVDFENWLRIEPKLGTTNLLPYIFISREKAIAFDAEIEMADNLQGLLSKLLSGSMIALSDAEKDLQSISLSDATQLFTRLESEARKTVDVQNQPNVIKGLFRIIAKHIGLESRLVEVVSSYPTSTLGVWAISEFSGLKTEAGKGAFKKLLQTFGSQTENKILKSMANLELNKN